MDVQDKSEDDPTPSGLAEIVSDDFPVFHRNLIISVF